jgi:putative addiction module component (TIGR02574 family)
LVVRRLGTLGFPAGHGGGIIAAFAHLWKWSPPMAATMKALGLDRLSLAERILLVEELWDSIATSPEVVPLTEAHKEDLQRRLDAYRDDPKAGSPWEEVKARLRGATE